MLAFSLYVNVFSITNLWELDIIGKGKWKVGQER